MVVKKSFEHIVIGAGALGSAVAYRLAEGGCASVLVIEQFDIGHGLGASEDHSRIIRRAYNAPHYTELTAPMYEAWREIEDLSGLHLVTTTGGLDLAVPGTAGEQEVADCRAALHQSHIAFEDMNSNEIRSRWPQWRIPDEVVGLYQAEGGILDIRRGSAAHVALARQRGVEFLPGTRVHAVSSTSESDVQIETSAGNFTCGSLIICAGSWSTQLLQMLGVNWKLWLSQEQVTYFATANVRDYLPERFPTWLWYGEDTFYGFPVYGEVAVKASRHLTKKWVTAETRSYETDPVESGRVKAFLQRHLPTAVGPELYSKTCVYDLPPDHDFVLDTLPGHPRVTVGIGAGHAAKFAALLGKILADLATAGKTRHPISAFRADRPALTDPSFRAVFLETRSPQ